VSEAVTSVPRMTLSIGAITVDCADAETLAGWWAEQLDAEIVAANEGWYVVVSGGGLPVGLAFQKVDDPTPGKNRLHLDLKAPDLDAEVARLREVGATEVAQRSVGTFRWVTMADPDGNQFCVSGLH
jgi:predicted enzyme related to lactoylglutathione lyase